MAWRSCDNRLDCVLRKAFVGKLTEPVLLQQSWPYATVSQGENLTLPSTNTTILIHNGRKKLTVVVEAHFHKYKYEH